MEYYQSAFPQTDFVAGTSPVPVAGRVFDAQDVTWTLSWYGVRMRPRQ